MKRPSLLRLYVILSILFLISFFYFFLDYRVGLNIYDEGLIVYGATRILDGDIPYRDFHAIYAPAQFYVLAATFKIFGTSIVVERILGIITQSFLGLCVYLLARKLVPHKFALISWILYVTGTCVSGWTLMAGTAAPAMIFSLLSLLCLTNYLTISQHGNKGLLLAGMFAGIATLFRHDFGFYTFILGFFFVFAFTGKIFDKTTKALKKRVMAALNACLRYCVGMGMIVLPISLFLLLTCPVNILVSDLIVLPLMIYPKFRSLPFPSLLPANLVHFIKRDFSFLPYMEHILNVIFFYSPFVIFATAIIQLITRIWRDNRLTEKEWIVMLYLLMGAVFFNYLRIRPDVQHLFPFQLSAILVFSWLLQAIAQKTLNRTYRKYQLWAVAFLLAALLVSYPVGVKIYKLYALTTGKLQALNLERADGIYPLTRGDLTLQSSNTLSLQQAIEYIKRYVPPGERIFVGNSGHNKIVINDIMFYFLSNRHSATRYYHFDPGVQTTSIVQQKMINEIEEKAVNYVVLWNGEQPQEPNESNKNSGVHDLDNFIHQNYEACKTFGLYTILRRIHR